MIDKIEGKNKIVSLSSLMMTHDAEQLLSCGLCLEIASILCLS